MKILMVINCLSKGGRERRMLELVKGLKEKNKDFDIYLICLSDQIDYQYVYDLPIRFEIINKKDKDFGLIFKLRKVIRNFNPDIIHSWDVMSSGYLTAAKLFLNKIIVNGVIYNSAQNSDAYDREYFKIRFYSAISDITVANSRAGLKAYKASPDKSICIYNGIDFKRFDNLKPASQVEFDILKRPKGDSFVATMVAAFETRKDYDTLIDAAIRLCQKNPRIVFLLIGKGATRDRIMARVPVDLLNTRIHFLGMRDDIESILQISDAGLLISEPCEGLSNSVIEYMAAGKPAIATEGGGTDELIIDGQTGFLVKYRDSDHVIEKLEELMTDRAKAIQMGKAAQQWVRDHLDVRKMTQNYINLYEDLVKRKGKKKVSAEKQLQTAEA